VLLADRLQKHNKDTSCMVDIVTWKVDQVAAQLSALVDNTFVWDHLNSLADTSEELALCYAEVVFNVITVAADFYRRFTRVVRSYPLLFLWLVRALPHVACSDDGYLAERSLTCE
jgi:hypothetical protein